MSKTSLRPAYVRDTGDGDGRYERSVHLRLSPVMLRIASLAR
jgi:hypothetical protein